MWPWLRLPNRTEDGASAVEYGLVIVGIAAVCAAVVFLFGDAVSSLFEHTCDSISTASSGRANQLEC